VQMSLADPQYRRQHRTFHLLIKPDILTCYQHISLPQIARALGVGQGTVVRALNGLSKNLPLGSAL
jgi:hypothetical protein